MRPAPVVASALLLPLPGMRALLVELAQSGLEVRHTSRMICSITAGGKPRLPKIGGVPVRWSRNLPAEPSSVTVVKDAAGRFFASFVVEVTHQPLPPVEAETGIDLGLGHFAVLSDGRKIDSPRFPRRAEKAGSHRSAAA